MAGKSGEAFSQPEPANAARIKAARWREDGVCLCGAWRGELGSEPTPSAFVEHLLTIFDEVYRVLRKDGLVFCNIGDSYSGSGKGPTGHNGIGDQEQRQGFSGSRAEIVEKANSLGYRETFRTGNAYVNQKRNMGVAGIPAKNLLLVPQRFAIGMQERGWIVRSEICWAKKSSMPESVKDRPSSAWEPIWMFAKSQRYFYDGEAVRQPHQEPWRSTGKLENRGTKSVDGGANQGFGLSGITPRLYNPAGASLRNFWLLGPSPFADAHFATFPPEIPRRAILAGTSQVGACPACGAGWVRTVERKPSRPGVTGGAAWSGPTAESTDVDGARQRLKMRGGGLGGGSAETSGWQPGCPCDAGPPRPCVVLDPFLGSGTTALVADRLGRDAIGIELSEAYASMAKARIESDAGSLFGDPVAVEAPTQGALFDDEGVAG